MQFSKQANVSWPMRSMLVELVADSHSGNAFTLRIFVDDEPICNTSLQGDMVHDRVIEHVQNALRQITNDLSNHLKELRTNRQRRT